MTFDIVFLNLREKTRLFVYKMALMIYHFFYDICASELFCKERQYSKEHSLDTSCQSVVTEAWFRSHASPCRICGRKSASSTRFSPSNSISSWQYQTTWTIMVLACDVDIHWADWEFLSYEMARFIIVIKKNLAVVPCCERNQSVSYLYSARMYDTF